MIRRFEKFTYAITSIHRYLQKIMADEMSVYGLKGAHAYYLITLLRHPQEMTAARLCELCDRDKADVSRSVMLLEKQELVMREGSNPYRALIKLTTKGQAAAESLLQKAGTAVECGGKGLSVEKRAIFYEALDLIAANLSTLSKEGLPGQLG